MKKLNLLDQSTSFKVNDTGTIIPFNAFENNQPFGATADNKPVFRIKNEMGFLKTVNATLATGGYIFQLNTKDLVGLVPGTYEIELAVTDTKTNEELIFPDSGFCSFNITKSALTVTGTQIPTMSLDSFKEQLEQYVRTQVDAKTQEIERQIQDQINTKAQEVEQQVQKQVDTKTQQLEKKIDDYAKEIEKGAQGEPGPKGDPGPAGQAATITIGKVTTSDDNTGSVTNEGTPTAAKLDFKLPIDKSALEVADQNKATLEIHAGEIKELQNKVGKAPVSQNQNQILQDGTDLNTLTSSGVWEIRGATFSNGPAISTTWGLIISISINKGSNGAQLLFDTNNNTINWRLWNNYNVFSQWKVWS